MLGKQSSQALGDVSGDMLLGAVGTGPMCLKRPLQNTQLGRKEFSEISS